MFAKSPATVAASLVARLTGNSQEPMRITLANACAVLARVGMVIAPDTLRKYANGERKPRLHAEKAGKTWYVDPDDVIAWALQYKDAPKRGRRK